MTDHDPRLDLPSSSTPPVEGSQWMMVKVGVWTGALVLIVAIAAVFARIATDVVGGAPRLTLPAVNLESLVKGDPDLRAAPGPVPVEEAAESDEVVAVPIVSATDESSEGAVTRPSWIVQPSAEYPREAARAGIEQGSVEMNCGTTAEGWVSDCRIVSETPQGFGFADATLRGVQGARMRAQPAAGALVEPRVQYTTRYRLE